MDDERISQPEMNRLMECMSVEQLAGLAAYAAKLVAAREGAGHPEKRVPVVR